MFLYTDGFSSPVKTFAIVIIIIIIIIIIIAYIFLCVDVTNKQFNWIL